MIFQINPLVAMGVLASTAATDSAYVFFNAAVAGRRRVWAANWSAIWYLLSAFAVIQLYGKRRLRPVCGHGFVLGAFASVTWLGRGRTGDAMERHNPP